MPAFRPATGTSKSLTAGTTTGSVELSRGGLVCSDVEVTNVGDEDVYVAFGLSDVAATDPDTGASSIIVPGGQVRTYHAGGATHAAAITAANTAVVHFLCGTVA